MNYKIAIFVCMAIVAAAGAAQAQSAQKDGSITDCYPYPECVIIILKTRTITGQTLPEPPVPPDPMAILKNAFARGDRITRDIFPPSKPTPRSGSMASQSR